MSSRRHREHISSSRKEDYKHWSAAENDPDRARQSLPATQRHVVDPTSTAHDRMHRSTRRHDVPDQYTSLQGKPFAKDQSSHPVSMSSHHVLTQNQNQSLHPTAPLTTAPQPHLPSSRPQAQDSQRDAYSIRTKRRSEKRSSPSSDEKVLVLDQTKISRSSQQPRSTYPVPDGSASAPAATQTFWFPPASSTRDAISSSKRREREKEREKEKERKEHEREKSRLRDEQRAKDRAKEIEREREFRREEEEKDRRKRERGRSDRRDKDKSRDPESRRRDESHSLDVSAPRSSQHPSVSKVSRAKYHTSDERTMTRPQDQAPSMVPTPAFSQHVLPSQPPTTSRVPASTGLRREELPPPSRATPGNVTDHDKRRHRSHRDRPAGHQSAQESGMSSSEQEHSGRERSTRTTERRHLTRDNHLDTNHSGPSGSENERASTRSRRKYNRVDPYASDPTTQGRAATIATIELNKSADPRQYSMAHAGPILPSVPVGVQATSPLVGSTPFTYYATQVVSIRAGQGPSDPQTPLSLAKPSLGPGVVPSRPHEHGSAELSRPSAVQSVPAYNLVTHPQLQNPPSHPHSQQSVGVALQPTQQAHPVQPVRPPSTAPHAPTLSHPAAYVNPLAGLPRSHGAPSPAMQPPVLPPKGPIKFTKQAEMHLRSGSSMPAAHFAKLSVYRAPDPPVAAHLVMPAVHGIPPSITIHGSHYGDVHRSKTTAPDLPSKFPLNEDAIASVQANAHNIARTVVLPPASARHSFRNPNASEGPGNVSQHGVSPPRSSTYPSLANPGNVSAPHAPASSSPLRHQLPNPQSEDDTPRANPLPIPEPKTPNLSTSQQQPVQTAQAGQLYDPRSPKQNLAAPAPIMSSSPYQSSRPQVSPLEAKQSAPLPTPYLNGQGVIDATIGPVLAPRSVQAVPSGASQPSAHNYSPPRIVQYNQLRSPTVPNANSLAPATPKQSPSGRLHVRNGSNDTITQPTPSKYSPPNIPQKSLTQRSSIVNLQSHASSRNDTNLPIPRPSTSSGYPEPTRYRSPAPSQYPFGSSGQQIPHLSFSNAVPSNPSLPSGTLPQTHSRSVSHPVPSVLSIQVPSHDQTAGMQRGQNTPSVATPSAPTAASAIAAAYRQQVEQVGLQSSANGSLAVPQRVPSRAAPSPAPTINGRLYTASAPSATGTLAGGSTTATTTRPSRGYSMPTTNRPATAQPSNVHGRSVSDPQARVAISGHPSTPSPPKSANLVVPSVAPEQELLKTPSSLAPSMLPPISRAPSSHSKEKTKEKEKDKDKERDTRKKRTSGGFFGLFRSRSSPPKQAEVRTPVAPKPTGRPRASSHSTINAVAASVKNIVTPHPTHVYAPQPKTQPKTQPRTQPKPAPAPIPAPEPAPTAIPIVAPRPVPAADTMGPGGKMYSPFRLLSKRNRTVSAASYEAQDGTAANTVVGGESTRSSTAGRLSPPARDPGIATIDWRDQEEAVFRERGTLRRYRPGVTFDVEDNFATLPRPTRRSSRRGS